MAEVVITISLYENSVFDADSLLIVPTDSHYEQNRDKYMTIDDYLPVLINQFSDFNKGMIDKKLSK